MGQVLTWREGSGRTKRVELPGLHDQLTGAEIRKKFLSLRGYQQKQVYLLTVMHDYPLQVVESGLIAIFDEEKNHLGTSCKIEWLKRLRAYSDQRGLQAYEAFNKLNDKQQKIILMVLAEKHSIERAARNLGISRQHCNELYKSAILSVFPEYKEELPPVRRLREIVSTLMEPDTSGRERSGNTEDYLDHKADRCNGCGWDQSDEDTE